MFVIAEAIFRNIVTQEIDTITWILGESPSSVFATGGGMISEGGLRRDSPTPDAISMTMRFPRGTLATMDIVEKEAGHGEQYEVCFVLHFMPLIVYRTFPILLTPELAP